MKSTQSIPWANAQWAQMIWNRRMQFIDINRFPMSSGVSEWARERTNERSGAREQSELCGASEWVTRASERANGGANGPVLNMHRCQMQCSYSWFIKYITERAIAVYAFACWTYRSSKAMSFENAHKTTFNGITTHLTGRNGISHLMRETRLKTQALCIYHNS